jgi:NAD(P)-dependent dehydrogenase (short-subunit alcohol dehydrogenase family)
MTTPVPEAPVPHDPIARRFEGKVAFITGAARGQGRAEAVRLAAEGADIIAVDIAAQVPETQYAGSTPEDLAETVRLVEALDRRIVASQTDIRDYDALKSALDAGVAELGAWTSSSPTPGRRPPRRPGRWTRRTGPSRSTPT